jgi:hypothetical protein
MILGKYMQGTTQITHATVLQLNQADQGHNQVPASMEKVRLVSVGGVVALWGLPGCAL